MPEVDEMFRLDRPWLRAAFERAAPSFDSAAHLHQRIATELLERLAPFEFSPAVVLDLGAGTGRASGELQQRYPHALVISLDLAPAMLDAARRHQQPGRRLALVCGDALRLPLATGSVDLLFSSLMLHWCEPLELALEEVRRVLKPSGFFAFSTLGPATLHELRHAWAQADGYNHVNRFLDLHDVGDALVHAGLMEPVLDVDRLSIAYPDAHALMRELKAVGAHNVTAGRPRSLAGRARLKRVINAYEAFRHGADLPATYEVVYGATWGAAGRGAAAAREGEAHIAPGSIGRPGSGRK